MNGHRMLTAEREQRILDLLRQSHVMSVQALSDALDVSVATVRRDLQAMDGRKLLKRVRGGATLLPLARVEPIFTDKEGQQGEAKRRIAEAALELIEDHDTIYLDGGSTVLGLARLLDARRHLTIVTNSIMAAASLMESSHRLILVGGEFRPLSRTLVGPLTAHVIQALTVDKAFMGTIGFTVSDGMTTTDTNEAFTKTQILSRANQVILLADSSKIGIPSFVRSGGNEDIDILVTEQIDSQARTDVENCGIRIILAD